jgi:hypothetical protein
MRIFGMKKGLLAMIAFAAVGCSHALHLSNIDDIQPGIRSKSARRIKSHTEQFVVMGFVQQTDYVNEAYNKLASACPNGSVTGVNTRYSTSHGFFSWTNKIHMTGWCVEN